MNFKNLFFFFLMLTPFITITFLQGMESEISKHQKTGCPKWDGLLELQEAGLPTPHGVFVGATTTQSKIAEIVESFLTRKSAQLIALRADGKNGKTPTGIGFERREKSRIINTVTEWSNQGYGVSIMEGLNRFNYDFCCNVLLSDEDGNFIIEFVGPGFDGGDLNKSLIEPCVVIVNKPESPIFMYSDPISGEANIETLDRLCFRINIEKRIPTEKEIETRLRFIMERLLPDMGIVIERSLTATIEWLRVHECNGLLQPRTAGSFLSTHDLRQILFYTSLYANALLRNDKKISHRVLTFHKYKGKIICFGTHDGKRWGSSFGGKSI